MKKVLIVLLGLTGCTAGRGYIHPLTGEEKQAPFREMHDSQSIMAEQTIIFNQQFVEFIKILKEKRKSS